MDEAPQQMCTLCNATMVVRPLRGQGEGGGVRRGGEKRGEHMRDCVQGPQAHLYNGNSQDKWTESFKSCMRGGAGGGGGG